MSWEYHWQYLLRGLGSIIGSISSMSREYLFQYLGSIVGCISFEVLVVSLGVYLRCLGTIFFSILGVSPSSFWEYHRKYLRRSLESFIGIISFDVLGVSLGVPPLVSWKYHWVYLFRGHSSIIRSISSMSREYLFQHLGSIVGCIFFEALVVSLGVYLRCLGTIFFSILGVSPSSFWKYHRDYLRRGLESVIGIISFDVLGVSLVVPPSGSWKYHWEYIFDV